MFRDKEKVLKIFDMTGESLGDAEALDKQQIPLESCGMNPDPRICSADFIEQCHVWRYSLPYLMSLGEC